VPGILPKCAELSKFHSAAFYTRIRSMILVCRVDTRG